MNHSKNSIIYPVKMSLCKRTVIRIALWLFHGTKLLLCRYGNRSEKQTLFPQKTKAFFCNTSCNGFCCQVKQLFSEALTHGFQRRVNGGKCLPDSCRRLDKQICLSPDSTVNRNSQLLLPLPVLIRKRQLL